MKPVLLLFAFCFAAACADRLHPVPAKPPGTSGAVIADQVAPLGEVDRLQLINLNLQQQLLNMQSRLVAVSVCAAAGLDLNCKLDLDSRTATGSPAQGVMPGKKKKKNK